MTESLDQVINCIIAQFIGEHLHFSKFTEEAITEEATLKTEYQITLYEAFTMTLFSRMVTDFSIVKLDNFYYSSRHMECKFVFLMCKYFRLGHPPIFYLVGRHKFTLNN